MKNLIGNLLDRYKFKTIYFDDDTFNIGNRHTTDMCEIMSEFKIPWFAMCRADTIRKETWKIMIFDFATSELRVPCRRNDSLQKMFVIQAP